MAEKDRHEPLTPGGSILSFRTDRPAHKREDHGRLALTVLLLLFLLLGRQVLYPVRALVWHLDALLWWGTVSAACLGQGTVWFRLLGGGRAGLSPGLTLSVLAALGLGSLSLEVLLLAAAGLMNTPALTGLVLIVLAASVLAVRGPLLQILTAVWRDLKEKGGEALLPLGMVGLSAVITFPLVLVPTRAFDALSYHLEVPLRYLQAGSLVNIPENLYSYAPLLTQMLYGLGLGLAGADLAGLLYYLFFLITLWTVWSGGGELFGNQAAAWSAAILALVPVFLVEVPQAGADWSMTLFLLASLFLVAPGGREPQRMILAGVLAGLAAGCRHQALGYGIVLIPVAGICEDLFRKRARSPGAWALFTLSSLLSAAPWYAKNLLQTGDPLYPLLSAVTGKVSYSVGFVDSLVGPRSLDLLWNWILVPYQATFDPPGLSMTASIGILPVVLALGLPFVKDRRGGSLFLLLWAALSFAAWHLTFRTFRYAMPVVAVLCLWPAAALDRLLRSPGRGTAFLKMAVGAAFLVNAGVFLGLSDYVNRSVDAALGARSPERYLMQTYEIYPALNYLNELEPAPGKVLFLGEMRGFYSRFPREVPSHNAPNRLLEMIKEGKKSGEAARQLTRAGFTHVLFNPEEMERMAYGNRNAPLWVLTVREREALESVLRNGMDPVFEAKGVTVYRIRHEP